ncbi:MAG: hypothetical protein HQM09_23445 [Candidatus Riflebacteria bacterium]|nr:hypothetical protein [Candidatus Riflebacteria bacterium]
MTIERITKNVLTLFQIIELVATVLAPVKNPQTRNAPRPPRPPKPTPPR